jgi:hypothetical protein
LKKKKKNYKLFPTGNEIAEQAYKINANNLILEVLDSRPKLAGRQPKVKRSVAAASEFQTKSSHLQGNSPITSHKKVRTIKQNYGNLRYAVPI